MQGPAFQRRIENFTCEQCGAHIVGNGYTNHCPKCLWSKHVDLSPGDRASTCGGMMRPVRLQGSSPDYAIVHRCEVCGHEKRNKTAPNDDTSALLALASSARA